MNAKVISFFDTILCLARITKLLMVFAMLVVFSIVALPYLIAREMHRRHAHR